MKVTILTGTFPKISETFVFDHITGLIDRDVDTRVIADKHEHDAFLYYGSEMIKYKIAERTSYYNMPATKSNRIRGALSILPRNLFRNKGKILNSINCFKYGGDVMDLRMLYLMNMVLKSKPLDILHCHFGPKGILGACLKQANLVNKLVVSFHGYDVSKPLNMGILAEKYRSVFEQADLLLPISEHWRNKLIENGAPAEKTHVHRLGIEVDKFHYRVSKPKDETFRVISIARLIEKKGLKFAIEAVNKVKSCNPGKKIIYDIIGDGKLKQELLDLIRYHKLEDCINLLGSKPHAQIKELLSRADVFLLPSVTAANGDQEGIPVSIMEAMAVGLPILSTLHSGIPELVEDGVSGLLSSEKDTETLAENIVWLSENPLTRIEYGKAGRAKVFQDYNAGKQNNMLVELYKKKLFISTSLEHKIKSSARKRKPIIRGALDL